MNIPIPSKAHTAGQDFWKSGDYTYRSNLKILPNGYKKKFSIFAIQGVPKKGYFLNCWTWHFHCQLAAQVLTLMIPSAILP